MHILMSFFKPMIDRPARLRVHTPAVHNLREYAAFKRQINRTPRLSYSPANQVALSRPRG